ncbi:MAG: hypothetical protein V1816_15555 [Pseudomonadota bacterium]
MKPGLFLTRGMAFAGLALGLVLSPASPGLFAQTTYSDLPAPPLAPSSLYDRGSPLDVKFPKYFNYVADPDGIGGSGVNRIKVVRVDPETGRTIITYDEVREVGEIIGSMERGYQPPEGGGEIHGKLLLSFYDDVLVRFTQDVGKILDSASHEDQDPYFREYPIYGLGRDIIEPDADRPDEGKLLGRIHEYKGKVTIFSRVETLAPLTQKEIDLLSRLDGLNLDSEPVSYVGKVTYSEQPVNIGDRIFLFKSLFPGPERQPGSSKAQETGRRGPSVQ